MTYREKTMPGPTILIDDAFEVELMRTMFSSTSYYDSQHYGHDDVRVALDKIYHGKCAYCETRIEPVATPQVDHYRPVNTYTGEYPPGQRQNHRGYYWLGYEWTNLVLSCPACNGTKSSKFHLSNPANRVTEAPALVAYLPNYPEHLASSASFSVEDPLLINPERKNPDIHLAVNYYGLLEPINDSPYGQATIDICDLNWDKLYENRLAVMSKIIDEINTQLYKRYRRDGLALTEGQFKESLFTIFKKILERTTVTKQYNMVGRCMIAKFEDLILPDIEDLYQRKVMKYFIEFLQTR
ncbi:hypothetical protein CAP35_12555 [Chitinophagaceae bacterium IBVUCB1]|nr:hypothetical protein CAP35_12555 [Chitinophagaceae bacterium IBVUCB1]